jgi:peptide chain release factor subunit 1
MDRDELSSTISDLRKVSGSGTTLITLYIPGDRQLSQVAQRLDEEYGGAANIKSKATRKAVQTGIDRARKAIRAIPEMPENGIAVFSSVD